MKKLFVEKKIVEAIERGKIEPKQYLVMQDFVKKLENKIERPEEMLQVVRAKLNGKFSAFDYKSLQEYTESLEIQNQKLKKEIIEQKHFIDIMNIKDDPNVRFTIGYREIPFSEIQDYF